MIRVRLTYAEILLGWHVAAQRATNALKRARDNGQTAGDFAVYGAEAYAWTLDVQGALGELAVAKGLNLWWGDFTAIGRPDVGGKIEVRSVNRKHLKLILHPGDVEKNGQTPFVLADLSELPDVLLVGWIRPSECITNSHWWGDLANNGRPAYWVPRETLHSCVELRGIVHRQIAEEAGRPV